MTTENDRRITILKDDSLDPSNTDMFDAFIEGFMQAVIAMIGSNYALEDVVMSVRSISREWKAYRIRVVHEPSSLTLAQFTYNPEEAWERLVGQFIENGYSRSDSEELVVFTMGVGPDSVRERVKKKVAAAAANQAVEELGIESPDSDDLLERHGFKPDKGEA